MVSERTPAISALFAKYNTSIFQLRVAGGVAGSPAVGSLTEEILVPNTFAKIVTNTEGKDISRSVSSFRFRSLVCYRHDR